MTTNQKPDEQKRNYYRFYVSRPEQMGDANAQIIFPNAIYASEPAETVLGLMVGAAIGPADTIPQEKGDDKVKLSSGGIIVPARPDGLGRTVPTIAFKYTDKQTGAKHKKKYVSWVRFVEQGDNNFAMFLNDQEDLCNFEITVGHLKKSDGTDQLILAGRYDYGCVPYNGGKHLMMPKSTKKIAKVKGAVVEEDDVADEDQGIRVSEAKLIKKREGALVGGYPLWTTYVYEIRFSERESEAVLVNQFGAYYLASMVNGKPDLRRVDTKAYGPRYEARLTKDLVGAAA